MDRYEIIKLCGNFLAQHNGKVINSYAKYKILWYNTCVSLQIYPTSSLSISYAHDVMQPMIYYPSSCSLLSIYKNLRYYSPMIW